jgi:iron complex outermembrane receptor protein
MCLSTNVYAQRSVTGKISDENGAPVKYSTITIRKDSVLLSTTSSDTLGNYRFSELSNGHYSLAVSYLKNVVAYSKINLTKDTTVNFQLKNSPRVLSEVTVSSDKPVFIRKTDRFVFIPNNLLAAGASGIEILQHTPMVRFDTKSEVFGILNRKNTVIYINNKKNSLPNDMIIQMLKSLPAGNIKSVEIITNPGSEYNANITGGIININIKRQVHEGWFGNISLNTQQSIYNTSIANGTISYRKGKVAFQIIPFLNNSYNYSITKNTLDYTTGQAQTLNSRNYRRYLVTGGGVNFDYDIDQNNSLSYKGWISHINGNSKTSTTTTYSLSNQNIADSLQAAPYKGRDTYLYNFGNINYHRNINDKGSKYLDVNVDYNQFRQNNIYNGSFERLDADAKFASEISRYRNELPQRFFNLSEKAEYKQPIDKSSNFSAGIQHSDTHVTNDLTYKDFDYNTNTYQPNSQFSNNYRYIEIYSAAFLSINKDFGNKVSASLGLRAENTSYHSSQSNAVISANNMAIDTSYLNWFPSASISYAKSAQHQFSLSFSKKITRPGIESLFPGITYYTPNYFNQNNPFLQPIIYFKSELVYSLKGAYNFIFDYSVANHAYGNFTIPVVLNNTTMLKSTLLNYGTARSFDFAFNANLSPVKDIWETQFTPTIDYSLYKSNIPQVLLSLNNISYNLLFDNTIYISKAKKWIGFVTFTYISKLADISGNKLNATSHLDIGLRKILSNRLSISVFANDIYNGNTLLKYRITPNAVLTNNYQEVNSYTRSVTLTLRMKVGNLKVRQTRNHAIANDELKNRTKQ